MKKYISLALSLALVFSLSVSANAAEPTAFDEKAFLQSISEITDDFQNEEGCSSSVVTFEADSHTHDGQEIPNANARATTPPSTFYNIANNGIYKGSFSGLRGTIYTNYYFDMVDGQYHSRVSCYGYYPNLSFKVGNYCVTCKKVLSTTTNSYSTPSTTYTDSDWVSIVHTVGSTHESHFVCPFVMNSSGLINDQLYAIGGDIWVNYYNDWS